MPNWYVSLEAAKKAVQANGVDKHAQLARIIEAASRQVDKHTHRRYIPETQTRVYRWPRRNNAPDLLWLDADLLSVTSLKSEAQNSSPTTIAAADYFLEPANYGPPYNRIEIDLSSSAAFQAGDTPQRSIEVVGSWGYGNTTKGAGTVSSGLASDAAATSMVGSGGDLIDVGDPLLIQSEQLFVSDRSFAALGTILVNDTGITADKADVSITVDAAHGVRAGEVIRLESEQMYVESVSGNVLTVIRAYNGTVLVSHADNTAVHINRTFTVERAVNGTTAATHADATAVSKYVPPVDITGLCLAEAVAAYHQENSGWARQVGAGENQAEFSGRDLQRLRKEVRESYCRHRSEAI